MKRQIFALLIRGSLVRVQEGEQKEKELHESVALSLFTLFEREVYPERSRRESKRGSKKRKSCTKVWLFLFLHFLSEKFILSEVEGSPRGGAKFDKPLAIVAFLFSTCFKPLLMLFYWLAQIFFQITSLIA